MKSRNQHPGWHRPRSINRGEPHPVTSCFRRLHYTWLQESDAPGRRPAQQVRQARPPFRPGPSQQHQVTLGKEEAGINPPSGRTTSEQIEKPKQRFPEAVTEEAASSPFSQHPDVAYNLNHNDWLVVYVANLSGATSGLDIYGRRVRGVDSVPESEEPIDEFDRNQTQPTVAAYRPNFPPLSGHLRGLLGWTRR